MQLLSKFKYLIIDGSNFYHRCYHLGSLQHVQNKSKTLDYHVLNFCIKLLRQLEDGFSYNDSEIYFLFDNSQSQINIRKQIDPKYKSNRDKQLADKEVFKLHNAFIELLKVKSNKYRFLMAGSLEADDLVKPLIKHLPIDKINQCALFSNDLDWSRNIQPNVYWNDWVQTYTQEDFYSKFGYYASEEAVKISKALKGDPADHIPVGCKNLKNSDYKQICNDAYEFESFDDFQKYMHSIKDDGLRIQLRESFTRIKRNYQLVDFVPISIDIKEYIRHCYFQPIPYRLFLQSLGLQIPDNIKSKQEIENDFFDV